MRRCFVLIAMLVMMNSMVAFAESESPFIDDGANVLSSSEISELTAKIEKVLKDTFAIDNLVIVTRNGIDQSPEDFAADYYDQNGYSEDGILLLLDLEERDWYISTSGRAISRFSDDTLDLMGTRMLSYLKDERYDSAFSIFIDDVAYCLENSGREYWERYNHHLDIRASGLKIVLMMLPIALTIALIIINISVYMMNHVSRKKDATKYATDFKLIGKNDIFLRSHTTVTEIKTDNNSGGRGGGGGKSFSSRSTTRIGSSGRTHGGRGGKF